MGFNSAFKGLRVTEGPFLRPRCIGTVRAGTQINQNNDSRKVCDFQRAFKIIKLTDHLAQFSGTGHSFITITLGSEL